MSEIVLVNVGLDYHDESLRVCVMDEEGRVLCNRNVPNDPGWVRDVVDSFGDPRVVVIEACSGAADLAEKLIELYDWNVKMAHASYVQKLKRGPDKTDRQDARLLADLGRTNHVPEVWLPDEATRQLRRLVRFREGLKSERKNVKLRMRALLREERIPKPLDNPWTKGWMKWLKTVPLGEQSRWVMDREIERLARLKEDLKQVEKRMEQATAEDPLTQTLLEQKGIGLVTAVMMRAIIGRFERFGSGKQLARFCGVTPCNASSGKRQADAGLVKAGSRELRAVIIQTAKRLPTYVDKWRDLKRRLVKRKPANVATAAVANRWLRWLYHQIVTKPVVERVESEMAA